ncbi:MAG: hypothetical protein AAGU21_13995 [Solidesulfovibrio sp.]
MDQSDALHLIYLALLLAAVVAMRWWPGRNCRKFDWRSFKRKGRKKD